MLGDYAWYNGNSSDQTQPVETRQANVWGLHDTHGNVWEFCLDRFGTYPGSEVVDWTGPTTGGFRVNRGGGYNSPDQGCRSAVRNATTPDQRLGHFGFRVVVVRAE